MYTSGTTGTPKGIVHSHKMRWQHIQRGAPAYGPHAVTILSTPLYSNTTMASFMPTVGSGGQVVLMKKFDARGFLELAARERATNTMLVPVQYQRLMDFAGFDDFDLATFTDPQITVVSQPVGQIGPLAVRMLLDRISGHDGPPRHTRFATRLIVRGSVSRAPAMALHRP